MIRQSLTPQTQSISAAPPVVTTRNESPVNVPKSQPGKTSGVDFAGVPAYNNDNVKSISASGAGKVATTYTPDAADTSTKIVFIQVMKEYLDGSAIKPSVADPAFAYQDADTTADFYHVDYVSGEKDPFYNGDDVGLDGGTQGNATSSPKRPATMSDTPEYHDWAFPAGKTSLLWEFSTAAFSAAGADVGKYYGTVDWKYSKTKAAAGTTAIVGTRGAPGTKFDDAVSLWNSNHGFSMPVSGRLLGGIIGGGLGAFAGAGLGFLLGGVGGAIVGGTIGAGLGAAAGSRIAGP